MLSKFILRCLFFLAQQLRTQVALEGLRVLLRHGVDARKLAGDAVNVAVIVEPLSADNDLAERAAEFERARAAGLRDESKLLQS